MCGRFASELPPELIARLFQVVGSIPNVEPSWNVAPTQSVPVVRRHPETGERHLDLLRWGLIPNWSKDKGRQPINARAETVASSGMFRGAFSARRCVVPMQAFYEWKLGSKPKQPFAFGRVDEQPLALAGLWESWKDPSGELFRTFAIITTEANATLAPIHDRMPVVLEPDDWKAWLDDGPTDLLRPADDGVLRRWLVSSRVNSPRNDDRGLLDEVEEPGGDSQAEAGPDSM